MYSLGSLVSSIKNGFKASKLKIVVKNSKFIVSILDLLLYEGYISGYTIDKYLIIVFLKSTTCP